MQGAQSEGMHAKAFEKKFMLDGLSGKYLIIGLSGGADSISLVHFLAANRGKMGCKLLAVHLNHSLRGDESDRDEQSAKAFCIGLDVPFISRRADIGALAEQSRQSEEVCGRQERYRLFVEQAVIARQQGMEPVIVTAHTLSDNLETAFLHLLRGCALDGLCGIPDNRMVEDVPLIRPMLRISREEVEGYCAFYRLPFVTDSTNLSDRYTRNFLRLQVIPQLKKINPSFEAAYLRMRDSLQQDRDVTDSTNLSDRYTRNFLRLQVIPQLKKINPSFEAAYLRMRDSLQQDRDYLNSLRDQLLTEAASGCNDGWEVSVLGQAPKPVKSRAAAEILRTSGVHADAAAIESLTAVIDRKSSGYTAGRVCLTVRGGILTADDTSRFVVGAVSLPQDGTGTVIIPFEEWDDNGKLIAGWERKIKLAVLSADDYREKRKVYKNLLYFAVDYDTIMDNAQLRARGPGDSIRLSGRGGQKTLKKLFQQAHLSRRERELRLVLAQGSKVIWVEGFGIDEASVPGSETEKVLAAFRDEAAATERMKSEYEPQDDR